MVLESNTAGASAAGASAVLNFLKHFLSRNADVIRNNPLILPRLTHNLFSWRSKLITSFIIFIGFKNAQSEISLSISCGYPWAFSRGNIPSQFFTFSFTSWDIRVSISSGSLSKQSWILFQFSSDFLFCLQILSSNTSTFPFSGRVNSPSCIVQKKRTIYLVDY